MIGVFKVKKIVSYAEIFIILGVVFIVAASFMLNIILGVFVTGISLIGTGVVLLKVVAKGGG